jgi:signal transduction histidine kinase
MTALVQSISDASEIASVLDARGWHTTLSNDAEKTAALLESAPFNIVIFVDSTGSELDLATIGEEHGTICIGISTSLRDHPIEDFDYSFNWSLDADPINQNLAHCERLAFLKSALAKAKSRSRLFIEAGHQLKSPVAVMKEFTQLLNTGIGGDLTQKQSQYVQVIDDNINRLLRLLENIEALGSLDFNGWTVNLEELDCRQIIERVAASWATMVESKDLVLHVTQPGSQLSVMADMSAVEQILFNLIDNAIKYCPAQGTITLDCIATDERVIFGVANDGASIPVELHESIFYPFHRLPDHAAEPGLGLGLTIARKLASAMQAKLYLDSKFAGGARFLLSIPLN